MKLLFLYCCLGLIVVAASQQDASLLNTVKADTLAKLDVVKKIAKARAEDWHKAVVDARNRLNSWSSQLVKVDEAESSEVIENSEAEAVALDRAKRDVDTEAGENAEVDETVTEITTEKAEDVVNTTEANAAVSETTEAVAATTKRPCKKPHGRHPHHGHGHGHGFGHGRGHGHHNGRGHGNRHGKGNGRGKGFGHHKSHHFNPRAGGHRGPRFH